MTGNTTTTSGAKDTGPLDWRIAIVDKTGRPTQEFQRKWATQRANNALIGSITFGTGAPTGSPSDGAEYVDTTKEPWVLYIGENSQWNIVGVQDFINLDDVPGNYTNSADHLVRVNGNATGLEFVTVSTGLDSIGNATGDILVRGNSTWGVLPPGNSTNVLTSNGSTSAPSWQPASGGGGGGTSPLVDGIPVTLPSLSALTWMNQGSATATQHTGGPITLQIPAQSGDQLRGLQASVPGSTPWTCTVKLGFLGWNANFTDMGMYVIDSSGKLCTLDIGYSGPNLQYVHWNSNSSFNGEPYNSAVQIRDSLWFRLENTGTNFLASVSPNGADWFQYFSESSTAFLGTPVACGIFGDNNSSFSSIISIWSFELVTGTGTNSTW